MLSAIPKPSLVKQLGVVAKNTTPHLALGAGGASFIP
jgi:hypothetical protein